GLAAFTGKLTVGKSQLLAHPVTHSGFRLQHDDLTSRTYSHLPIYLGKTIVAEVDGAIAANEVLAEPKVTIYIEKMYSSSDCSER
ncbi:hypothetical protein, partial [Shewanella algae]|uniref:hypothetical protein n=1 Tax=Shewanella algae TaxID=38313 RepID=UPI001CA43F9C